MTVGYYIRGLPVGVVDAIKGAFDVPSSVNLVATGNSQATALPLPRDFNVFATVASGAGAILPFGVDQTVSTQATADGTTKSTNGILQIGDSIRVVTRGAANALLVYPQLGGSVQAGAANAGFSVAANKMATFYYLGAGNFAADLSS